MLLPLFLPPSSPLPILSQSSNSTNPLHRPPVMLRVQKSRRRRYAGPSNSSSLVGRFLPTNMEGMEEIVQAIGLRDDRGPPTSTEEYGPESMCDKIFGVQKERWSVRSEAARRKWENDKWRKEVLEKRRRTLKESDAKDGDNDCEERKGRIRQRVYRSEPNLDNRKWLARVNDRVENRLGYGRGLDMTRDNTAFKKERMMMRRQTAIERHRRMKLADGAHRVGS